MDLVCSNLLVGFFALCWMLFCCIGVDLGRWFEMNHGITIGEQGNDMVFKTCQSFKGVKLKLVEFYESHISVDINRGGK